MVPARVVVGSSNRELKEHSGRLNAKVIKLEESVERGKELAGTLTRKLEKSRGQNTKLVEQLKESVNSKKDDKAEDNEMRDAELGELRKVGGWADVIVFTYPLGTLEPKRKETNDGYIIGRHDYSNPALLLGLDSRKGTTKWRLQHWPHVKRNPALLMGL